MGSLFRSEEMCKAQLFLQSESAYACVAELGELGLVQFRDLNPDVNAFQRKFVNEVRRCDEMERQLRFIEKETIKAGITIHDTGDNPEAPAPRDMIDLEASIGKLENEMTEVNTNQEALKRNFLELVELKHILQKTQQFFSEMHDTENEEESSAVEERSGTAMRLGFVAGVIQRERIPAFEQMLWRVCRGNVFLRQAAIETALEDPVTGDHLFKTVFIVFFQGDQLKNRVLKICEGFRAVIFPCPESKAERREMAAGVNTRIDDLLVVLNQTAEHRERILSSAAENLRTWFIKVRKLKAIYHTLNLFNLDVTQKCLIAECWCPVSDLDQIHRALKRGTERSGSTVPSILNRVQTSENPPTFNKVNKFTSVFQSIVDAYGVASYREVNPAPYIIITYPFLFSVMFGDSGHGFILMLVGLYLILRERQLAESLADSEMFGMFYAGRYIIFMMGLFSLHAGFMYNDTFSKSFKIFQSGWSPSQQNFSDEDLNGKQLLMLDPNLTFSNPYPYGLDPIWQVSSNKLNFLNSYKMKISVIFGITQMTFGVVLSFFNHKFYRKWISVFTEFIPQMIFMLSIFGYLVIMIILKWFFFNARDPLSTQLAPNLIITLINMFLFTPPPSLLYSGQQPVQACLVIMAVLSVPVMLLGKPLYLMLEKNKKFPKVGKFQLFKSGTEEDRVGVINHDEIQIEHLGEDPQTSIEIPEPSQFTHGEVEEEIDLSESLVHQAIHTIEFCLGCISHTASYLRLWALSLAHAELSDVLWSMMLRIGLTMDSMALSVVLFGVWAAWAVLTVCILLLMEGLSAFLHTLRLHWVEFQSKFYSGEGYAFRPFSFAAILDQKEE